MAAARRCIGARFRPHGRAIDHGLDCVGVAAIAFDRPVPAGYPLRGGDGQAIAAAIDRAGLRRIEADAAGQGSLVLLAAGLGQFHLAVLTERGFVHADAGLRRVVETPGRPGGIPIGVWNGEG